MELSTGIKLRQDAVIAVEALGQPRHACLALFATLFVNLFSAKHYVQRFFVNLRGDQRNTRKQKGALPCRARGR